MFYLGDRVKLLNNDYGDSRHEPVWGGIEGKVEGTIVTEDNGDDEFPIEVEWDNGSMTNYKLTDLKLLEPRLKFKIVRKAIED